jgi:hypothetical protein
MRGCWLLVAGYWLGVLGVGCRVSGKNIKVQEKLESPTSEFGILNSDLTLFTLPSS